MFQACFGVANTVNADGFALRNGECFRLNNGINYKEQGPSNLCSGRGDVESIDVYLIAPQGKTKTA